MNGISLYFIYINIIAIIVVISSLYLITADLKNKLFGSINYSLVIFLFIFTWLMIGLMPIPWNTSADRELYANYFIDINKEQIEISKDKFFHSYMFAISLFGNYKFWFILTSFVYCYNYFLFIKRTFSSPQIFIVLLMFFSSLTFFAYGINTIRAGLAASFLLLSLSYRSKSYIRYALMILAINIHFSMIIPALIILISTFYSKTKLFYFIWLISIPLSAVFGNFFEHIFVSFSFDTRTSYLLAETSLTNYKIGFRLDFILYSCIPIILGYYYIFYKRYNNKLYLLLYNTYILTNCFWILIIRANFSDRFAYLSWFLYPIILIFPLLKRRIWDDQNKKIALIVILHGSFTYFLAI